MSADKKSTITGAMLQLFQQELGSHCRVLQEILRDNKQSIPSMQCEQFLKACRSINGTAKLVEMNFLVDLSQMFENVFSDFLRSEIELNDMFFALFISGTDFIQSLAEVDEASLEAWVRKNSEPIRSITLELATLLNAECGDSDPKNSETPLPSEEHKDKKSLTEAQRQEQLTKEIIEETISDIGKNKKAASTKRKKTKSKKRESAKKKSALTQAASDSNEKVPTKKASNIKTKLAPTVLKQKKNDASTEIVAPAKERSASDTANNKISPSDTKNNLEIATINRQIDPMMLELFQIESETNVNILSEGLVALEKNPGDPAKLEALMRASHSIKGAARMIELDLVVTIAHSMEDCFVAAQESKIHLKDDSIDILLQSVDMLTLLATLCANPDSQWGDTQQIQYNDLCKALISVLDAAEIPADMLNRHNRNVADPVVSSEQRQPDAENILSDDRILRISASRVNTLMGLSGEMVVNSGWIKGYSESLVTVKRRQTELINSIDYLRTVIEQGQISDHAVMLLNSTQEKANECRQLLTNRLNDLEEYDRRAVNLAGRLNHEVLASRMRPFEDGVKGFPRMVRDVARTLSKQVDLEIIGLSTQVDRDILEKIEAPLNHIIRNAVDHGIESPEERVNEGKPAKGTIILEARHSSGMLSVVVKDDGRGVDIEKLRLRIVEKGMVNSTMAADMTESELLDFLFLPGFSTRDQVTEISGRGVGLDVVHTAVQEMRGKIRSTTELGFGLNIQLQLPLTLSVIRCLLVDIDNEPYAFPLARINSILSIVRSSIEVMEDRQFIQFEDRLIGLVDASQVLGTASQLKIQETMLVIIIGDRNSNYGIVVSKSLGEHSLAVQPLDSKLGKVRDISAAAILNDGNPTLIIDVDDMIRSIENLVSGKRLNKVQKLDQNSNRATGKRILVVDDSLTVREVERKLLESHGYVVDIAVDGMDGWNSVRTVDYDLVVSDVDMPRMNGIEFVTLIKNDDKLRDIPVMIVSYKDRQEDRSRGLMAGGDYFPNKSRFFPESLIEAGVDLIGEAIE